MTVAESKFPNTHAVLSALRDHEPFGSGELDSVLAGFKDEDQFLEYKAGAITEMKPLEDLKLEIRRQVTGFANAEGGVLFIGISNDIPRLVTGAKAPGSETLVGWATRILADLAGFFSPMPYIFSIEHPAGKVLCIAVARAPRLVPFIEAKEIKYALRIGDSTLDVPPYLITDLVLGRRAHPTLEASDISFKGIISDKYMALNPRFAVENVSLVTAVDVSAGAITWSLSDAGATQEPPAKLAKQYLEIEDIGDPGELPANRRWNLHHRRANISSGSSTIRPFRSFSVTLEPIVVPRRPDTGTLLFGVYLMPMNSPPTWYQVECNYTLHPVFASKEMELDTKPTLVASDRPHVAWQGKR
jgi:Schlafen, AlbA_2